MPQPREVLVIRGRLNRAGQFMPGRSRSTPIVGAWPVVRDCDERDCAVVVTVELLDAADRVLHREAVLVSPEIGCEPGDAQSYRLIAYIQLRDDAAAVRLMRGDLEIWRESISAPPTLEVEVARVRADREKPVRLRLRYSPPGDTAHLTVVYKWGERRFQPVYIGPPKPEISIDVRDLPGGDECLLAVSYSSGLRSAHAATGPFRVPKLGPTVRIIRPEPRVPIVARTPVILEGNVFDRERAGGPTSEDLVWRIDGMEVATGMIGSVDGLTAGRHRLTLSYSVHPGAEASVLVDVKESDVQTADDWPEWDPIAGNN